MTDEMKRLRTNMVRSINELAGIAKDFATTLESCAKTIEGIDDPQLLQESQRQFVSLCYQGISAMAASAQAMNSQMTTASIAEMNRVTTEILQKSRDHHSKGG